MGLPSPLTQKWSLHPSGDGTSNIPGILILEIEERLAVKAQEKMSCHQGHGFLGSPWEQKTHPHPREDLR